MLLDIFQIQPYLFLHDDLNIVLRCYVQDSKDCNLRDYDTSRTKRQVNAFLCHSPLPTSGGIALRLFRCSPPCSTPSEDFVSLSTA